MPEWTKETAAEAVIKMAQDKTAGDLTTGMCEAMGISFEKFLQFSQLDEKGKQRVVNGLALILLGRKYGHCSQ